MSCRVLNRTVEEAVFSWIVQRSAGRSLLGERIPTEKNRLVEDLYPRLGFARVAGARAEGVERWAYAVGPALPAHHVTVQPSAGTMEPSCSPTHS
jgi:predicted enzyme involved in methoxymalonyl-ACP biosynthesis